MVAPLAKENIDEENKFLVGTGDITKTQESSSLANGFAEFPEVGIKFDPTDEILAGYYLDGKVNGRTDCPILQLIKEADIYLHDPSELSSLKHDFSDQYMYFFTTLEMKYRNGSNVDRLAPGGCWKKTENPSYIKDKNGKIIASMTLMEYYRNDDKSGKPEETQWLMKEYMLVEKQNDGEFRMLAPLTLCVVYFFDKKSKRKYDDHKNKQSSQIQVNIVEGSSPSGSVLPPTQNLDCRQNIITSSAENPDFPRKCHCPCSNVYEIFSNTVSISSNENQCKESISIVDSDMKPDTDHPLGFLADLFSKDYY